MSGGFVRLTSHPQEKPEAGCAITRYYVADAPWRKRGSGAGAASANDIDATASYRGRATTHDRRTEMDPTTRIIAATVGVGLRATPKHL